MRGEYGINPNVYNGGAVTFNSAPFANFFIQQQQKKQLKQEETEQYYQKQLTSLTPTGMRTKDIEGGWGQKAKEWQDLGMGENKKYILNPKLDNYETLNKFNRLHNELKLEAEVSKSEAGDEGELFKVTQSGKMNPTKDDYMIMQEKSKSIYDPTRRKVALTDLSINTPPFDPDKFLTDIQTGLTRGKVEDLDKAVYDSNKGIMVIPTKQVYTPETIKAIADRAPIRMQNDRSSKIAFERILESQDLPKYQEAYNKIYKGIVDTPEKVAQAYAIMGVPEATGEGMDTRPYTDKEADLARAKELARYNSGLNKDEIRLRQDLENKGEGEKLNNLTKHLDTIVGDAIKSGKTWEYTKGGKKDVIHQVPVSPSIAKSLMVPDASGRNTAPNGVGVDDNGNFYGLYWKYKKDANDNWVFDKTASGNFKIDSDLTAPIDRTTFQAEYANAILSPKAVEESGLNTGRRAPATATMTRGKLKYD